MRKSLFLIVVLSFILTAVACSHLTGVSGIGRESVSPTCAAAAAPWIGLDKFSALTEIDASGIDEPVLRAVTINIHSGMGQWKGVWSRRDTVQRRLKQIADAIAKLAPVPIDVVALNEVDFSTRRSGGIDQARYLADALAQIAGVKYEIIYGRTKERAGSGYGNAVLVRHAVAKTNACLFDDTRACGVADAPEGLPALRASGFFPRLMREGRGLIKLTLDFHGRPVDVIVTHLEAVAMQEREAQAAHLLRRFVDPARTTILLGDINAVPTAMTHTRSFVAADRTHDILTSGSLADARVLYDARFARTDFRAWATFPADAPAWPLDTAFASLDLFPREVRVMDALDTDHRGFYVAYQVTSDNAVIGAQRAQHDAIRQRQFAQIVRCDLDETTQQAKLQWLRGAALFTGLSGATASAVR